MERLINLGVATALIGVVAFDVSVALLKFQVNRLKNYIE